MQKVTSLTDDTLFILLAILHQRVNVQRSTGNTALILSTTWRHSIAVPVITVVMGFHSIDSLTKSNPASVNHGSQIHTIAPHRCNRHPLSVLFSRRKLFRRSSAPRVRFVTPTKPPNKHLKEWLAQHQLRKGLIKVERAEPDPQATIMSNPYVYKPSTPLQYPNQFQQTPYYFTPRSNTPFLPDANLYNSPYSNPNSLPGTPHVQSPGISGGVPFPSSGYDDGYASTWENMMRQRRPSWHSTQGGPFLQPQPYPVTPVYNRRHSFGNHAYQPPQYADWSQLQGGLLSPQSYFAQSFHVNPWINAEAPRGDFVFDLASGAFLPLRLFGGGQSAPLSQADLDEPATFPTLTRLRIVCDMIPDWPIDLEFQGYPAGGYSPGYQAAPPPITLGDVFIAIHRSLHQQIRHEDWMRLSPAQEKRVAMAYTKRCKAAGSTVDYELAQGVKKVDFLLKRTRMVGLLRGGNVDGWDVMKLIVAEK